MKPVNLQDLILNQVRKERVPVTVYLTNGFQVKGTVVGFDSYVVLLDCDGKQNLIYKHAISTVIPFKHIDVSINAEASEECPEE